MSLNIINFAYIAAAICFILGLKMMAHPRTSVKGNIISAVGMLLAIVFTLWDREIVDYRLIPIGLVIGSGIGAVLAIRIKMTAMPQMVALLTASAVRPPRWWPESNL